MDHILRISHLHKSYGGDHIEAKHKLDHYRKQQYMDHRVCIPQYQ